jgi:hypothetical protein
MILKYIILKKDNTPIFFANSVINQANIAFGLGDVISAGYCILKINRDNNKISVRCYGRSSSLNISSNPEKDNFFLEQIINPH